MKKKFKKIKYDALYLSVNVFSTKALIGDTIFYVSYWRRGTAILPGHPSYAKVQPLVQGIKGSTFITQSF